MIDITELENKLDKALADETNESLTNWLDSQRNKPIIIKNPSRKLLRLIRFIQIKQQRDIHRMRLNKNNYFTEPK
jgi:hypothetical protein